MHSVHLSLHIFILTFSTELSMAMPFHRHIQDLDHRVWVLQDHTLTMVPKRRNVVPGEGSRQFLWEVPLCVLGSAFHFTIVVLTGAF